METQNQNFGGTAPAPMPPAPSSPQSSGKNTGMAILAYLSILVVIPLIVAKDDPYVKFHTKQGLVLLIGWIVVMMLGVIPFLGWLISFILWIALSVLSIMGIINAVSGKETPLPLVGGMAKHFNF